MWHGFDSREGGKKGWRGEGDKDIFFNLITTWGGGYFFVIILISYLNKHKQKFFTHTPFLGGQKFNCIDH